MVKHSKELVEQAWAVRNYLAHGGGFKIPGTDTHISELVAAGTDSILDSPRVSQQRAMKEGFLDFALDTPLAIAYAKGWNDGSRWRECSEHADPTPRELEFARWAGRVKGMLDEILKTRKLPSQEELQELLAKDPFDTSIDLD